MRYCIQGDSRIRLVDGSTPGSHPRLAAYAAPNSEVDVDLKVLDRKGRPVARDEVLPLRRPPDVAARTREGSRSPVLTTTRCSASSRSRAFRCCSGSCSTGRARHRVVDSRHIGCTPRSPTRPSSMPRSSPARGWPRVGVAEKRRIQQHRPPYFEAVVDAFDPAMGGALRVLRAAAFGEDSARLDGEDTDAWSQSGLAAIEGPERRKRVPEFVWHAGLDVKQAFLQALFEGDGCVSYLGKNTVQISYSTRSDQLTRRAGPAAPVSGDLRCSGTRRRDQAGDRPTAATPTCFAAGSASGRQQANFEQILDATPGSLSTPQRRRPHPVPRRVRAGRERARWRRQEMAEKAQLRPHRRLGAPGHEILATSLRPK